MHPICNVPLRWMGMRTDNIFQLFQTSLTSSLYCLRKQWNRLVCRPKYCTSHYFYQISWTGKLGKCYIPLNFEGAAHFWLWKCLDMKTHLQTFIWSCDSGTKQLWLIVNTHHQKQMSCNISNWMFVKKPTASSPFKRSVTTICFRGQS